MRKPQRMSLPRSDALSRRINKLPKWARDYIHHVRKFVGAPEIEELIQLRDERQQLIELITELKSENWRLQNNLKRPSR
jgi:lysyl-tRNA synthetase class I